VKREPLPPLIAGESIPPPIRCIPGQRVIVDADLGRIYGVQTRNLKQAIGRNPGRFPGDFIFDLTRQEMLNARTLANNPSPVSIPADRPKPSRGIDAIKNQHRSAIPRL